MVACGKSGLCKPQHGGWSMERYHGHVPGARVGQRFDGKGALCFARLHCNINAGIDCLCVHPRLGHPFLPLRL